MENVFIRNVSSFLPNHPVENSEIENYLGLINGQGSRVKNVILRQNGIRRRYYALDENNKITHSNAEMAMWAIKKLATQSLDITQIDALASAVTIPDQILPSQASVIQGLLHLKPIEIYSYTGACLTSLEAFKTLEMGIRAGVYKNAIACASELLSPTLRSENYDLSYEIEKDPSKNPYIAFEKDFLRFMLSDGAGAVYLSDKTNENGITLKVEWTEMQSYAGTLPSCMTLGCDIDAEYNLRSWKYLSKAEIAQKNIFVLRQDIRLLNEFGIKSCVDAIEYGINKHNVDPSEITYMIPHVSSMFFYNNLNQEMTMRGIDIPEDRWFTNLCDVGNIGSAAIWVALEELFHSGKLLVGDRILLMVPESARFSFGTVLLSVV